MIFKRMAITAFLLVASTIVAFFKLKTEVFGGAKQVVEWVERNEELDMVYKNGLSNYNNWDIHCEKWEPNTT